MSAMKSLALAAVSLLCLPLASCVMPGGASTRPATATTTDAAAVPALEVKPGGNIEVTTNGRSVVYDRNGNMIMRDPDCTEADIQAADRAVKAHLAEQSSDFLDV